jgi:uncharacterized protein YdhG (YjbR/CyaY superfamily)
MDDAVEDYVDAISPQYQSLFERMHNLILAVHPEAAISISYEIPTYKVGRHRLYVGVWKHGISIYGWEEGRDGGFTERHPALRTGKGTIKLRPADAAEISDDELLDLVRSALGD